MRRPHTLRGWLLNSTLLALLAGYGVLLLANWQLYVQSQRRQQTAAVEAIQEVLQRPPASSSPELLASRLQQLITPGQVVWLEAGAGNPMVPPRTVGFASLPVPPLWSGQFENLLR